MTRLKKFAVAGLVVCTAFGVLSTYLYVTAPVEGLRGVVTYTTPYRNVTRQAGLGLTDNVQLKDMPVDLILATIESEDVEFPVTYGVSLDRIYRRTMSAFNHNYPIRAVSTITQQLVKNIYTGTERSLWRKYVEAVYALKVHNNFSLEEIFTLYANIAETSPGHYGFRDAAQTYFHKEVPQLSTVESIFIVTNLQSPDRLSAWFREGTPDPKAYDRLYSMLVRELVFKLQFIDPHSVTDEQKEHFFSQYMLQDNNQTCPLYTNYSFYDRLIGTDLRHYFNVHFLRAGQTPCISLVARNQIILESKSEARAFILRYWKADPAKVGITSRN